MLTSYLRRAVFLLTLGILTGVESNAWAQTVPTQREALPAVADSQVTKLCAPLQAPMPQRIPDVYWEMSKCAQAVIVSLEGHSSNPAQIIALTFLWEKFYRESLVFAFPGRQRTRFQKFEQELSKDPTSGYPVLDELIKYAVSAAVEWITMVKGAVQQGVLGIFDATPSESAYSRYQFMDASVSRLSMNLLRPHLEKVAAAADGTSVWKKWDAIVLRAYPAYEAGHPSALTGILTP